MSTTAEVSSLVAGILAGPAAALYLEPDTLTTGHKIAVNRIIKDAISIHTAIRIKVFSEDAREGHHIDVDFTDNPGGTE